jgi:hypothetical protein
MSLSIIAAEEEDKNQFYSSVRTFLDTICFHCWEA